MPHLWQYGIHSKNNSNNLAKISSQISLFSHFVKQKTSQKRRDPQQPCYFFYKTRQQAPMVGYIWPPKIKRQLISYFIKSEYLLEFTFCYINSKISSTTKKKKKQSCLSWSTHICIEAHHRVSINGFLSSKGRPSSRFEFTMHRLC